MDAAKQRGAESLRQKREQMRDQPYDDGWRERADRARDRPLPKRDPGAEERAREMREKKRAEREAVHRAQQALDRPGGAGTSTSGD